MVTGVIAPQLLYLFLFVPLIFMFYISFLYMRYHIMVILCLIFCGSGYLMMCFTLGLAGFFVFLLFCCQAHTVNKVLLHIDNMLILVKVKLQTNGN